MPRAITDDEVDAFTRQGFVHVHGFLDPDETAASRAEVDRIFASGEEWAAGRKRDQPLHYARPMGPLPSRLLNRLLLLPEIASFVRRTLEVDDPVVVQTGLYAKYQSTSAEQGLHVDFRNNEMCYPSRQRKYQQVSMMMFHDDVTIDNAPTHFCPRARTEGMLLMPNVYAREDRPELYEAEIPGICAAGSLQLWDMRTFHRGTYMRCPTGRRVHSGGVYASGSFPWIGMRGWGEHAHGQDFIAMMEDASSEAQGLLGVPPPGHDYWDEETISGTAACYPRMDLSRHRAALAKSAEAVTQPA
jgi:hypothetical protein